MSFKTTRSQLTVLKPRTDNSIYLLAIDLALTLFYKVWIEHVYHLVDE